jgi:hypothetical protein
MVARNSTGFVSAEKSAGVQVAGASYAQTQCLVTVTPPARRHGAIARPAAGARTHGPSRWVRFRSAGRWSAARAAGSRSAMSSEAVTAPLLVRRISREASATGRTGPWPHSDPPPIHPGEPPQLAFEALFHARDLSLQSSAARLATGLTPTAQGGPAARAIEADHHATAAARVPGDRRNLLGVTVLVELEVTVRVEQVR